MLHNRTARIAFVLIILAACVAFDQVTKDMARRSLDPYTALDLLGGVIRMEYSENAGATLNLGADLPAGFRFVFFGLITGLVLIAMFYFAIQVDSLGWLQLLGVTWVAAGGVGNYLDRLLHAGIVRDFVSIGIDPLRTGIFNAADVFIMAGGILFIWASLRQRTPGQGADQ